LLKSLMGGITQISSIILPLRLVRLLSDILVFLTMGIIKVLRGC
jgi:hypothetical protein